VESENREEHLKGLARAGINVQEAMETGRLECCRGPICMCATTGSIRMRCWRQSKA
jgi:hypothetical protein